MYQLGISAAALAVCTYTDIKSRKIEKKVLLAYLLLSLTCYGIEGKWDLLQLGAGLLPGLICLLISFATREGLGYGDSLLILVCGLSLGVQACVAVVLGGFFLAGIWAAIIFLGRRGARNQTFPFVPFLFLSLILWQSMEYL